MSTTESLDPAERRLSLGHRLVMLGHIRDKFRRSRLHLDRYRHQMMDQSLGAREPEADPLGGGVDDMLVLGNVTVTTTTPAEKPEAAANVPTSKLSAALPYVLTALATAAGLGGAGWAAGVFDKPEPPAQESVEYPSPPGYGLSL